MQWSGRCCYGGALAAGTTSAAALLGNATPLGRVGGAPGRGGAPPAPEERGRALRPRRRQQPHSAAGSAVDSALPLGGALGGLLHVRRPGVTDVAPPHSRHVLAPRGSPPEG